MFHPLHIVFYESKCLDIKESGSDIELRFRNFFQDIVKECRKFYVTIINDLLWDHVLFFPFNWESPGTNTGLFKYYDTAFF